MCYLDFPLEYKQYVMQDINIKSLVDIDTKMTALIKAFDSLVCPPTGVQLVRDLCAICTATSVLRVMFREPTPGMSKNSYRGNSPCHFPGHCFMVHKKCV